MTTESSQPLNTAEQARHFIQVPRWIVTFQIGLLSVLPLSCFLLGFGTARLAQPASENATAKKSCLVSGKIESVSGSSEPSVILLLPLQRTPSERLNPSSLNPASFQAVDNSVIQSIQQLGGGVARTNSSGAFRIEVEGPGRFLLVATSLASTEVKLKGPTLTREEMAELSRYFLPVESLFEGHRVQTLQLRTSSEKLELGTIQFDESP